MASNKTGQAAEQAAPPEKMLGVYVWAALKNTPAAVFAGVCRANGWADGKQITEAAYTHAVDIFLRGGVTDGIK